MLPKQAEHFSHCRLHSCSRCIYNRSACVCFSQICDDSGAYSSKGDSTSSSIAVYDMFGYEDLVSSSGNKLEQLCINLAHERLQACCYSKTLRSSATSTSLRELSGESELDH